MNPGRLLTGIYICPHTGAGVNAHQAMTRVTLDTRLDQFQMMYQNSISYPWSLKFENRSWVETKAEIDKIISEEIENNTHSDRQWLGPHSLYAVAGAASTCTESAA